MKTQNPLTHQLFSIVEMVTEICHYLPIRELIGVATVDTMFYEASRSNDIWSLICGKRWRNREYCPRINEKTKKPESLYPNILFLRQKARVKPSELCNLIKNRSFPKRDLCELAKCVEKAEMIKYVVTSTKKELIHILASKMGVHDLNLISNITTNNAYYPLCDYKWFSSYTLEFIDSQRRSATFDDIADRELKFHFKHHQTSPDSLQFFANCSFRSDYEFTVDNAGHNENHPNGLQWKFFGARDICGGYRNVQVPPYPTMTISRLRQGGWLFENEHVRLFLGGF